MTGGDVFAHVVAVLGAVVVGCWIVARIARAWDELLAERRADWRAAREASGRKPVNGVKMFDAVVGLTIAAGGAWWASGARHSVAFTVCFLVALVMLYRVVRLWWHGDD
ncbi:hypothetical protein JL101_036440 (plasmid) [Skermanella rosea]|uniref:hypothetical protein n=1 Tax=Skermanella rosea TaxID=1817965 RepID=UPI001932EDDD|nr:hypothetical protein [Skermanella rosea]UEM08233.1 hypothetical protein JL101_036440 [Skermanella rosea]